MSSWARAVEIAHVGTMSALVGIVGLDPFTRMRSAPDWPGWIDRQQRLDRTMSRVAPPLFLSTTAAAAGATAVALARHQGSRAVGRAVATGCTAAAVALTLVVNEPLNARVRAWRSTDPAPEDWRDVRSGWEQGHRYRRLLIAAAALASTWGFVAPIR